MKVYVLTVGSYSDYHILGVFTSREKALEYCPALDSGLSEHEKPDVEEWDLDPERPEEFMQETWWVYLWLSDGSVYLECSNAEDHSRDYSYSSVVMEKAVGRSVVSREHAMKLAVECRQAYLREQAIKAAPLNASRESSEGRTREP